MPQPPLYFVYGTLRRGDDNDITLLSPPPRFLGQAKIVGQMFHLGNYPGVTLGEGASDASHIVGEVYEINPVYVQGTPIIASGDWVKDR